MLISGPETTIQINEAEHLCITGYFERFRFTYHIYSEAVGAWIKQDMELVRANYPLAYDEINLRIEDELYKNQTFNQEEQVG